MKTVDHQTHYHPVIQEDGKVYEEWGVYYDLKHAATAIEREIGKWQRDRDKDYVPLLRRHAYKLAQALRRDVPEGYELRWFDVDDVGDLQQEAYGYKKGNMTIGDYVVACWSAYVVPLLPEGEDYDGDFYQDSPVLLTIGDWAILDQGKRGVAMRGGALEIKDWRENPLELTEEVFSACDRIQAHFTQFENNNLNSLSHASKRGAGDMWDNCGWVPDDTHKEIERCFRRYHMYRNLNAALGRVPRKETETRWLTEDSLQVVMDALADESEGRAGIQNRFALILAEELTTQRQAYLDVRQYEGEELPEYLPYVLENGGWSQAGEDVLDYIN